MTVWVSGGFFLFRFTIYTYVRVIKCTLGLGSDRYGILPASGIAMNCSRAVAIC